MKSIAPTNPELWPKRFAIFEKSKNRAFQKWKWSAILEPVAGPEKKCLAHYAVSYRVCGENLSQIRPPVPEKSALLRKNFQKVIQLVGITSSSCPL